MKWFIKIQIFSFYIKFLNIFCLYFLLRLPTGHSRVTTGVLPSTGFSPATGPGRISFTQDFSRTSGHQVSGIRPTITDVHKVRVPAFPQTVSSPGYQTIQRNAASFGVAPKPVQKPVVEKRIFKAPAQPVVQQPTFTAIQDLRPIHGSVATSGSVEKDKSAFVVGPEISVWDNRADDYKHNVASIETHSGDKFIDGKFCNKQLLSKSLTLSRDCSFEVIAFRHLEFASSLIKLALSKLRQISCR